MSKATSFQFLRHCFRTFFGGERRFHKTKAATILTVSAKHASTTTESQAPESPILSSTKPAIVEPARKWEWLPLHTPYKAARKTIVLCHGNWFTILILTGRVIWV